VSLPTPTWKAEMSDTSNDLEKGHQFGSYEIVRLLGKGAFGAVYEALRQPLKKRTALKVLHPEFVRHQEVVARFLQEAETVAQLDHPHIVGVFDVGVQGGVPFIAMEFLDGEPLASRLEREGKLATTTAVDLMLAVFSAVSTVHEKGIIHRDLKPDNIFLARPATGGVQPKLLDFGIAKVRDVGKALTRTNAVLGTPFYMSPEQAEESKNISNAADQWSLSVILYEAITGAKAFDGDSLLALLNSICFHPTPDPRTQDPSVHPAMASALMRAMSKKAADRFPSVRDFGRAILPFASPGAQNHWGEFFAAGSEVDPTAALMPSYSSISPAHAITLGERRSVAPPAALALPTAATAMAGSDLRASLANSSSAGTLEPATRSTLGLGTPRSRTPLFLAATFAGLSLVAGLLVIVRPSSDTPTTPTVVRPAAAAAAPVTPVPAPSAPAAAQIAPPAVAPPPEPTPTVAPSPAPVVQAPVGAVDAGTAAAPTPRGSSGRRRRPRRSEEGDRPTCVNGICPPV